MVIYRHYSTGSNAHWKYVFVNVDHLLCMMPTLFPPYSNNSQCVSSIPAAFPILNLGSHSFYLVPTLLLFVCQCIHFPPLPPPTYFCLLRSPQPNFQSIPSTFQVLDPDLSLSNTYPWFFSFIFPLLFSWINNSFIIFAYWSFSLWIINLYKFYLYYTRHNLSGIIV